MIKPGNLSTETLSLINTKDIKLVKLIWMFEAVNDISQIKELLNAFDNVAEFRRVFKQIPLNEDIPLYDADKITQLFVKYKVFGMFAECKVPVRYGFTINNEFGYDYKTKSNPSYILVGYEETLERLIPVLQEG